ncbi:MAG: hypothetical protein ACI4TI_04205 [Christensenellales bacterium]
MWEFCLYFNENQLEYILKLRKHLKRVFKSHKGCVVLFEKAGKLLVATNQNEKTFIKIYKYIYNNIVNIIYNHYKSEIINCLSANLFNNEIFELMVKQTLLCFDEEYDKNLIRQALVLNETLNLDGFFNFRLVFLKQKWEHLVELIKNNANMLNSYSINLDLTRYLLSELENNIEKVCLFSEGKKYILKTINNEKITFKKTNFSKKQNFKELLKSLIVLSPKNIILCSEIKKEDFEIFHDLFIDKLI